MKRNLQISAKDILTKKGVYGEYHCIYFFFQAYQTQQRFKILTLRGNEKFIPIPTKHADESLPKAF